MWIRGTARSQGIQRQGRLSKWNQDCSSGTVDDRILKLTTAHPVTNRTSADLSGGGRNWIAVSKLELQFWRRNFWKKVSYYHQCFYHRPFLHDTLYYQHFNFDKDSFRFHFAYLLTFLESDETIKTTLMSVSRVWSTSLEAISLA